MQSVIRFNILPPIQGLCKNKLCICMYLKGSDNMAKYYNEENLIHYEGQFGTFDYNPTKVEPIIDEEKAAVYDEESGATMELYDYDPDDTIDAAFFNPSHYDFLIKGWNFSGLVPEGYHPLSKDIEVELEF